MSLFDFFHFLYSLYQQSSACEAAHLETGTLLSHPACEVKIAMWAISQRLGKAAMGAVRFREGCGRTELGGGVSGLFSSAGMIHSSADKKVPRVFSNTGMAGKCFRKTQKQALCSLESLTVSNTLLIEHSELEVMKHLLS